VIQSASAGEVVRAVQDGSADVGLSMRESTAVADLTFTYLPQDRFVMLCARSDPLARRATVDWRVFLQRPFIASGTTSSIRRVTDGMLATSLPQPHYVVDNISVVGAMVAAGVGIAAVPELALRLMDARGLQSVALHRPAAARDIGVMRKRKRSLSAAATHFVEMLVQEASASTALHD